MSDVNELRDLLNEWEDEDYGYSDAWEYFYNEEGTITFDDGRTVEVVQTYRSWPSNDPMINVIVKFGDKFYHNDSYYDSWGGSTDWNSYEIHEVEKVQVTKEEWKEVKNG